MAEQEACAHAVTEALAAAGESVETEEQTGERGESLLLPLLQGLLQGDGQRLLAGLGAASHDVVADVRRSLQRLRLALAPPADHPQARALLALVDRLEDALDAADRLDGCKRRPRRRSRTARHTVGVTREELEEARRLVDRDQLLPEPPRPQPSTPATPNTSSYASTAPSTDEPPTPERKTSVDEISYHDAVEAQEKPRPVPHSVTYDATPKISRDACVVERRVATARKPDFYRHSIADAIRNEAPRSAAERWHSESRRGIAAIAHKFDSKAETEAPAPIRRAPMTRPAVQQPAVGAKQKGEDDQRRSSFYRPPPPTYNFAALPSQDDFSRTSRFMSNKRSKIKRANTIDIGRPFGGYRIDPDTDDENSSNAPKIPTFQPQTENDKKFLAFMQKNENMERGNVNGQSNWSSRFGNIKNTFEHRDHDENSRSSSSSSSAKKFWQTADENIHRPRKPANDVAPEVIKPPWVSSRNNIRPQLKQTAPPVTQVLHPSPPPQSANRPIPVKPFVAKPIPVNQFSHAPMSAFKPPKKIMSPTTTPNVWSPPSANIPVSPTAAAHPPLPPILKPYPSVPPINGTIDSAPHWKSEVDHSRKNGVQAANFDRTPVHANQAPRIQQVSNGYRPTTPTTPPTHVRHEPSYPIRTIPSQNRLAAPELVMKLEDTKTYNAPEPPSPKIDARQLQIEFYEKQIREKNRRDNSSERPNSLVHKPPPPPPGSNTYTIVDYTPHDVTSTFVPLQQTPDIEKARAHKVDYLPDVVMRENNNHEYVKSPTMRVSSASPSKRIPNEYHNGASVPNGADDDLATEHGSVVTRVMRGPTRAAATITAGVRTRDAADSLRGVLDKFSSPKRDVIAQLEKKRQESARNQVRPGAPPQARLGLSPQHAPSSPRPTHLLEHDGTPRSPGAPRSPNLITSRESVLSSESPHSRDSSPGTALARSGSWHRFGEIAPKPSTARKVVARTKSMNLLAAPKLFEGGIAQNEITEKKRTVEAYFSGQATQNLSGRGKATSPQAPAARSRGRAATSGFTLGRSRTMPTVSELQFLDESNADDAFEDLVSALA